jgi:hypothetical protein
MGEGVIITVVGDVAERVKSEDEGSVDNVD